MSSSNDVSTESRMHVTTVFGTRPEAIKMAPVVRELESRSDAFEQTVCVTAQHREMLDQVLELFEIEPDVDLDLMTHDQDLTDLTASILRSMRDVLERIEPDLILVQGDTTTTTTASLAAFYQQIPVGHIEAGLRTGDRYQPWPEEINRKLTGVLAEQHFPPTDRAAEHLFDEGVDDSIVTVTGNTVIDALLWVRDRLEVIEDDAFDELFAHNTDSEPLDESLVGALREARHRDDPLEEPIVLVTGHRRENFGEGFREIVEGLEHLSRRRPGARIVYPVHLNPHVQEPVYEALAGRDNIDLIPPLDYAPFVALMDASTLVLTDSGGLQEEAPSLGKPVLVMRETTERPEALEAGTARLVGADADRIVEHVSELLDDPESYEAMAKASNPFGDGRAAERIVEVLARL